MEIIIGVSIVAFATAALVTLTLWSNKRINKLSDMDYPTARDFYQRDSDE